MNANTSAQGAPRPQDIAPANIQLQSLLRLRWGWVLVQIGASVVAAALLGQHVPVPVVAAIVLVTVVSNLAAARWLLGSKRGADAVGTVLVGADIVLFTALLHFTGGPENPFGFLYLVPISFGAYTLAPARMWVLVAITVAGSGALFWLSPAADPSRMSHAEHMRHMGAYSQHLQGMWIALLVAAVFIVAFVTRLGSALRQRDEQLGKMRERSERTARLASLTTLAAGAAHELATPLATIAVVSKELGRRLQSSHSDLAEDAAVIRQEVQRCRDILDRLSATVGGVSTSRHRLAEVVEHVLDGFGARDRVRVTLGEGADSSVDLPLPAVVTALRALLQNAVDASDADSEVEMSAQVRKGSLEFDVRDRGRGMDADTLDRAVEPFFTTKADGRGLGLFLAVSVAEQLGGAAELQSAPSEGTSVHWVIPASLVTAVD
ncbi:MAG: ATP-binding protein [Polyangiaceae bacterium]